MNELDECRECGAAVHSRPKHRRWHEALEKRLGEIAGIADEALERAEDAQNTLYQNNIQV